MNARVRLLEARCEILLDLLRRAFNSPDVAFTINSEDPDLAAEIESILE